VAGLALLLLLLLLATTLALQLPVRSYQTMLQGCRHLAERW
jgi:hypothetical protein